MLFVFFFKQKTAYEMRISDWSSDVCSSDLTRDPGQGGHDALRAAARRAAELAGDDAAALARRLADRLFVRLSPAMEPARARLSARYHLAADRIRCPARNGESADRGAPAADRTERRLSGRRQRNPPPTARSPCYNGEESCRDKD